MVTIGVARGRLGSGQLGQSEVENLDHSRIVDHHVGRLQVAVNDACRMGARQRIGNLQRILRGHIGRQTAARDRLVEGLPSDVLHHHVVHAVLRTDVVNDANVGVLQAGDRLGLLHKAGVKVGT